MKRVFKWLKKFRFQWFTLTVFCINLSNHVNNDTIKTVQQFTLPSKSEADKELKAKLSEFRLKLSRKEGLRAFRVFGNVTLEELVTYKPTNKKHLLEIKGIALKKYDWFGKELIKLIEEVE
jgi:superfamily II DNA helicase RecQ